MASKAQAEKALRDRNMSLDQHLDMDPADPYYAALDAPAGRYFRSEGTHSVAVGEDRKADMYQNIIDHLKQGIGVCSAGGCGECGDRQTSSNLGRQFNGLPEGA